MLASNQMMKDDPEIVMTRPAIGVNGLEQAP
jgi:hypothetical protein